MLGDRGVEIEKIRDRQIGQEKPARTEQTGLLAGAFAKRAKKQDSSTNTPPMVRYSIATAFASSLDYAQGRLKTVRST